MRLGVAILLGLALGACQSPFSKPAPEDCQIGVLTDQGQICQTIRTGKGDIYSFFADMNGYTLGEKVCICGKPATMTRCLVGVPIDLVHLDRDCPGLPPAF
ncbi:hypothetical protein [Aestuariispira insulae]|uniref:Lipoprotein n=1 Tax=Aestuariispira insulae TaxID=1461337 RepID=A0A3D9HP33_9PROT|nr:hypothetical protein [Aestuariispira insulae]RED51250.1 hypothetical protein DFP90_10349 [Aestuariispira insulae]